MYRLRALLAASFSICFLLTINTAAQDQQLQLGTPIERELSSGQTHTYTIALEENQFVQLVVEQRGIDVILTVASPAGKSLGTFDTPNGDNGPENVSFVAITPGTHRVSVAPLNQGEGSAGKYEIKLVEVRPASEQEIKNSKNQEVAKTKGIALLGEVEGLLPEIHSAPTRIRAQIRASQLLWDTDEKRAWKFLNDAVAGVKDYLPSVDPASPDYAKNYSTILQLRYELIQILGSRDPDAAMSFLYATKVPPSPFNNPNEQVDQERSLELFIADQIGAKDPKRAAQLARQSMKAGYASNLVNTIGNLRVKDPDLAAELANEIASKVQRENFYQKPDAAALMPGLLSLCTEKPRIYLRSRNQLTEPQPQATATLLSEATCHDLIQKVYDAAMSYTPPPMNAYSRERDAAFNMLSALHYLGPELDKTISGGAAVVQKKMTELNGGVNPYQSTMQELQTKLDSGQADAALESIQKMPDGMKEQSYIQLAQMLSGKGDLARARQIINDYISNPYQRRQALLTLEQQEMYQSMQRGKVDEALKTISSQHTPRERANLLAQIARQIGPGLKRTAAMNFLDQARAMLAPGVQAQDQDQMNALLEVARAFSRYDVKRAFEIVDPLVDQLNDICTAARTLEGFGSEYYDEDELDLQNGSSVANVVIQVSSALGTLANSNFDRAKLSSDRLRQPEVRLYAYLQIAQQTIRGDR